MKISMKIILLISIFLVMLFVLTGCKKKETNSNKNTVDTKSNTTESNTQKNEITREKRRKFCKVGRIINKVWAAGASSVITHPYQSCQNQNLIQL